MRLFLIAISVAGKAGDNVVFSMLMDAGKMLKAKIAEIKPGEWYTRINISIFLVDL